MKQFIKIDDKKYVISWQNVHEEHEENMKKNDFFEYIGIYNLIDLEENMNFYKYNEGKKEIVLDEEKKEKKEKDKQKEKKDKSEFEEYSTNLQKIYYDTLEQQTCIIYPKNEDPNENTGLLIGTHYIYYTKDLNQNKVKKMTNKVKKMTKSKKKEIK